jgi:hypothetical protein
VVFAALKERCIPQFAYVPDAGHTFTYYPRSPARLVDHRHGSDNRTGRRRVCERRVSRQPAGGLADAKQRRRQLRQNVLATQQLCLFFFKLGTLRGEYAEFNPWQCSMGKRTAGALEMTGITGDGEQLMGIGSLGTVGAKQPKNLTVVVFDNDHFDETRMQHSHSSPGTNLVSVGKGFGISDAVRTDTDNGVSDVAKRVSARDGVSFASMLR